MASFICHVFGVPKRVRLERIVMRRLYQTAATTTSLLLPSESPDLRAPPCGTLRSLYRDRWIAGLGDQGATRPRGDWICGDAEAHGSRTSRAQHGRASCREREGKDG